SLLVIPEEEQLFFQNGATKGSPKLIAVERIQGCCLLPGDGMRQRVGNVVAKIFKQRAMKLVCTRLRHHVHNRAAGEAKLGVVLSGVNLQLLNAVNGGSQSDVSILRLAVCHALNEHAVRIRINPTQGGDLIARLANRRAVFTAVVAVVSAARATVCPRHQVLLVKRITVYIREVVQLPNIDRNPLYQENLMPGTNRLRSI